MQNLTIQRKRTACVACGEPLPADIVFIGEQYPSAIFVPEDDKDLEGLTASSLNVTRCANPDCRLVQLSNEYNLQYVFDHYPYESGSTATMKQILASVIQGAQQIVQLTKDDVVLDIGGNDGTMLGLIETPLRARVNIDAAAGVKQSLAAPDYHYVHARFSAEVYRSLNLPAPRLITSVAMFYHLNNPREFCRDVRDIMQDDSVWVLQMTYLGTMLRDNIFDNIVHEHVAYYSLASLEAMLLREGLHIAEAQLVRSYGGSLRVFIVKNPDRFPRSHWRKEYPAIQSFEQEHQTNSFEALYAFNSRTHLLRDTLRSLIDHLAEQHGPLWGFGASTKGNMILQLLNVDARQIPVLLDNSEKKIGKKTTGSMIPIVSEAENLPHAPEYLFCLPYYYADAFVNIIRRKLPAGRKMTLVVPLPYPTYLNIEA